MDQGTGDRLRDDQGLASVEFVVAAALALLMAVWLADALVVRYAEGVMGTAAREAVRAASRVDEPVPACRAEAAAWLDGALGGSMGRTVQVTCSASTTEVTATIVGTFDAWLPGVPAWSVGRTATAVREP